ncbi:MAG: hypothetical protein WBF65_16030 [Sphingopyxis granuli]|uniref:hypothetical protein n=1 Tax=Sphingopyxis granuli TaxID=267128 RepID=UPI003C791F67
MAIVGFSEERGRTAISTRFDEIRAESPMPSFHWAEAVFEMIFGASCARADGAAHSMAAAARAPARLRDFAIDVIGGA